VKRLDSTAGRCAFPAPVQWFLVEDLAKRTAAWVAICMSGKCARSPAAAVLLMFLHKPQCKFHFRILVEWIDPLLRPKYHFGLRRDAQDELHSAAQAGACVEIKVVNSRYRPMSPLPVGFR
jgi:hypothetical protein